MPILTSIGASSAKAYGFTGGVDAGLFPFSSFSFTNCTATGQNGPTLGNCQTEYAGEVWLTNFFDVTTQGYQEWTVPKSGNYTFDLEGARGGSSTTQSATGGFGVALSQYVIFLSLGDVLTFIIGQAGTTLSFSGGGGGGSFVVKNNVCLLAAAGGQGAGFFLANMSGQNASTVLAASGSTSTGGLGGANAGGQGGAGFAANGGVGDTNANFSVGLSYANGFLGGNGRATDGPGGFGGGGGPGGGAEANAGGGGGGWIGGDGIDGSSPHSLGAAAQGFASSSVDTSGGSTGVSSRTHGIITISL